jgi:hypothetical protein
MTDKRAFLLKSDKIEISEEELAKLNDEEVHKMYIFIQKGYNIEFANRIAFEDVVAYGMSPDGIMSWMRGEKFEDHTDPYFIERDIHDWQAG